MDLAYQASDFAVCRAGAMTLAELAAAGLPAILIPLATAAGNHQFKNAQAVATVGGALLVKDDPDISENLYKAVEKMLLSAEQRKQMALKMKELDHPDSLDEIRIELEKLLQSKNSAEIR